MVKNPPAVQETQEMRVQSLGWEDCLEEEMATHSRILQVKFHGQTNLAGYIAWSHKESDTTEETEHAALPMRLDGKVNIMYILIFPFLPQMY